MQNPKKRYVDLINEKLLAKRTEDDVSISLNIAEHKFKKHAEKLNWVLMEIYKQFQDTGIKMFHLILALQDYFDMASLHANILNPEIKALILAETSAEYGIAMPVKKEEENQ